LGIKLRYLNLNLIPNSVLAESMGHVPPPQPRAYYANSILHGILDKPTILREDLHEGWLAYQEFPQLYLRSGLLVAVGGSVARGLQMSQATSGSESSQETTKGLLQRKGKATYHSSSPPCTFPSGRALYSTPGSSSSGAAITQSGRGVFSPT